MSNSITIALCDYNHWYISC